jgi:hypothetical protein
MLVLVVTLIMAHLIETGPYNKLVHYVRRTEEEGFGPESKEASLCSPSVSTHGGSHTPPPAVVAAGLPPPDEKNEKTNRIRNSNFGPPGRSRRMRVD